MKEAADADVVPQYIHKGPQISAIDFLHINDMNA
jgi:hypothetical protein